MFLLQWSQRVEGILYSPLEGGKGDVRLENIPLDPPSKGELRYPALGFELDSQYGIPLGA